MCQDRLTGFAPAFCAAAVLACSASTFAGFTTVKGIKPTEDNQQQILSRVYGGTFVPVGDDFTNGILTAHRMDDSGISVSSTDQQVGGKNYTARTIAKFSNSTSSFGCFDNGAFEPTMDAIGYGYAVSDAAVSVNMSQSDSVWALSSNGAVNTSIDEVNSDGRDHLVTYQLTGGEQDKYLLFWEDMTMVPGLAKGRSISDFNDLVIEVQALDTGGSAIPLPPAVYAGAGTLAALGLARLLRRR